MKMANNAEASCLSIAQIHNGEVVNPQPLLIPGYGGRAYEEHLSNPYVWVDESADHFSTATTMFAEPVSGRLFMVVNRRRPKSPEWARPFTVTESESDQPITPSEWRPTIFELKVDDTGRLMPVALYESSFYTDLPSKELGPGDQWIAFVSCGSIVNGRLVLTMHINDKQEIQVAFDLSMALTTDLSQLELSHSARQHQAAVISALDMNSSALLI